MLLFNVGNATVQTWFAAGRYDSDNEVSNFILQKGVVVRFRGDQCNGHLVTREAGTEGIGGQASTWGRIPKLHEETNENRWEFSPR